MSQRESWPGDRSASSDIEDEVEESEAEADEVYEDDEDTGDEPEPLDDEPEPLDDEPEDDEEPQLRLAAHVGGELDVPDDVDLLEGEPRGTRRGVGIVVSRANVEITNQLLESALETGVPVAFGVLTVDTPEQAAARVDRGAAAARTALEMADLFQQLRSTAQAQAK